MLSLSCTLHNAINLDIIKKSSKIVTPAAILYNPTYICHMLAIRGLQFYGEDIWQKNIFRYG